MTKKPSTRFERALSLGAEAELDENLRIAIRNLIERCDCVIEAFDLSNGQLAAEISRLSDATSAAEKALNAKKS